MEPLRTWRFEGVEPLTVSVYKPVVTIRWGDGPEAELSPQQVAALSSRIVDLENYFESDDPEML